MSEQTRLALEGGLAELLESCGSELIESWSARMRDGGESASLVQPILEEHLSGVLADAVSVLRGPVKALPAPAQKRILRVGFELSGLLREYDVLRDCIFERVERSGLALSVAEVRALSDVLAAGIAEGTLAYLAQREQQALVASLERGQREWREAERRLQALLDSAVDGIVTCDARGRIQSVNPAAVRIFGYGPGELVGRGVRRLLARPYRRGLGRTLAAFASPVGGAGAHRGWEVRGLRKDGTLFPLELSVAEVLLPQGRSFVGTVRDLSERRRAEEVHALLIETGTQLSQALDIPTTLKSLATVIVAHLADYCVVDLVGEDGTLRRMEVMARDPEQRRLLLPLMEGMPAPSDSGPLLQAMRERKSVLVDPVTPEWLDALSRDERHRVVLGELPLQSLALIPVAARGHTLGLVSLGWVRSPASSIKEDLQVAQDVVDRAAVALDNARLYQEAQDAVRMREDVVAIVSHDLRNPLNAISLATSALLRRKDTDERTRQFSQRIAAAAQRASRLIRDLLDFTQARVGGLPIQPGTLDFHEHVRRVVDEVRMAWPGRLVLLDSSGDGRGEWDEGRLAQVITNLVGNALQHGPEELSVRVSTRAEGDFLLLEVHNAGPAIPERLLPTLFEPYRRGSDGGETMGSLGL
ncbi:MAG: PAS domain S-box protein, partial [Cystobacter sp.]